jgi:hypothetical protein
MNLRRGLAFLSYPEIKQRFEDAASTATLKPVTVTEKPVSDPDVIKRLPPGTMTEITEPEEIKRLEGKSTPDPWTTLGERAAFAFGIPLAVLALGSSLLWALSGFALRQP